MTMSARHLRSMDYAVQNARATDRRVRTIVHNLTDASGVARIRGS